MVIKIAKFPKDSIRNMNDENPPISLHRFGQAAILSICHINLEQFPATNFSHASYSSVAQGLVYVAH